MKILKLTKAWRAPRRVLQPGDYEIPEQISLTLAKCARADGCGEIVEGATFPGQESDDEGNASGSERSNAKAGADKGKSRSSRKKRPPENKSLDAAPENKTEI